MITGPNSSSPMVSSAPSPARMTDLQSAQLKQILAAYDGSSLSDEDAIDLVSKIENAGVPLGDDLTAALETAGISTGAIGEQVGLSDRGGQPHGGGGPGRPGGGGGGPRDVSSVDQAIVSLITDATDAYARSDKAQSFAEYLASVLDEQGYDMSKPLIDFYA